MINEIFEQIKKEARLGKVTLKDGEISYSVSVLFNIVDDKILPGMPNIYIKDKSNFNNLLYTYVKIVLIFYNLEPNYENIKKILLYSVVNISQQEMISLDDYINKYINFYTSELNSIKGEKQVRIGILKYGIEKQSIKQETPYCFKAYFEKNDSKFSLPRISYGICNNTCYIYAIQNKDGKINTDSNFNFEVKNELRKINSSISKYRNVTPSFVVALTLFISFLKQNNIDKVTVVTPLPIRQANRKEVANRKINFYTMGGNLDLEELEKLKLETKEKELIDDYNSTVKFVNCFNRLKLHFDNLFFSNVNNQLILDVIDLSTNNNFLREIVIEKEIDDNGKISKYSSC